MACSCDDRNAWPGATNACPPIASEAVGWARAVPLPIVTIWGLFIAGRLQLGPIAMMALLTPITGQAFAAEIIAFVVVNVLQAGCRIEGVLQGQAAQLRTVIGLISPMTPAAMQGPLNVVKQALSGNVDVNLLCSAFNAVKGFSPETKDLPSIPCPPKVAPTLTAAQATLAAQAAAKRAYDIKRAMAVAKATAAARERVRAQVEAAARQRAVDAATAAAVTRVTAATERGRAAVAARRTGARDAARDAGEGKGGLGLAAAGAAGGFLVGGPVGAVVGGVVGYLVGGR